MLLYRTEIAVEPGDCFPGPGLTVRRDVATVHDDQQFVFFRRAQCLEHRTNRCFERKDEIVPAADDQCGNSEAGKKIEHVGFGQGPTETQTNTEEHGCFQPFVTDGEQRDHAGTAHTKHAEPVAVHIRPAHQIIDRTAEIFGFENDPVARCIRAGRRGRIPTLEVALENRN